MSAISQDLAMIDSAKYGEEVRGSIHHAIEQCYTDVTTAETLANTAANNANTKAGLADAATTRANQAAATAENFTGLVAPTYSTSATYAVGDYVVYNGAMYRCITAIDTAEAWTAAHWTAVNTGAEVTDLKSALNDSGNVISTFVYDSEMDFSEYAREHRGYLMANGDYGGRTNTHSLVTPKIPCRPGFIFSYQGRSDYKAVGALFLYNDVVISSVLVTNAVTKSKKVTIPEGANYVIFCSYNPDTVETITLSVKLVSPVLLPRIESELLSNVASVTNKNVKYNDVILENVVSYYADMVGREITEIADTYNGENSYTSANGYTACEMTVSPGEIFDFTTFAHYSLAPVRFTDSNGDTIPASDEIKDIVKTNKISMYHFPRLIVPSHATKMHWTKQIPTLDATVYSISLIEIQRQGLYFDTPYVKNEWAESNAYIHRQGAYLSLIGTIVSADEKGYYSDPIRLAGLGRVSITAYAIYNTALCCIFDGDMNFIASIDRQSGDSAKTWSNHIVDGYELMHKYPNARFVMFGSYNTPLVILQLTANKTSIGELIDPEHTVHDSLYGKVWYVIGDSATEGDFNSITVERIRTGKYAEQLPVYPFFIGNRTGMIVHNIAKCGAVLALIEGQVDEDAQTETRRVHWALAANYQNKVGNDADYITIWLGANDMWQNVPVGTIDSDDAYTFYGAYNRLLTYYINTYPWAKLGIVASYWCTEPYCTAVKAIGAKYGVPVLNFYDDPKIPVSVGSRRPDVSDAIKTIRNNQFVVSETNSHGSAKFHELESYYIEAWLRTL